MGLLDKLKNVFFEEEEEEVEVPVKKEKPVTVAKKIESVEYKRPKELEPAIEKRKEEDFLDDKNEEPLEFKRRIKPENDFKFPVAFDDKDFEMDDKKEQVEEEKIVEKSDNDVYIERKEEKVSTQILYPGKISSDISYPVNNNYKGNYESSYQGLYDGDKKEKKTGFTRSPIISPVYGVLDKNYRKEEIVTKKEIRLSVTPKKVDLDTVREKAYGDLASEITESMTEDVKEEKDKVNDDNLLYDLSEDSSPSVKVVTVGDAEEYYSDLGLEYNVDYKVEKETKVKDDGRGDTPSRRFSNINNSEQSDTSNLFDLIDSMYEEKE